MRGTVLDVFGYTAERRSERRHLAKFETDLDRIEASLTPDRIVAAVGLASVPMLIRGYGHVKEAAAVQAEAERMRLRERFDKPQQAPTLQAAE
jgi:indolepyruvate ferredoxin oxidoreductase